MSQSNLAWELDSAVIRHHVALSVGLQMSAKPAVPNEKAGKSPTETDKFF